ncbi:MAG: hypothetical protein HY904_22315 [Deltaproteobacteria bacterium]|nr:hypothetical protein [Deltaproteobacteria bacterium]
MAPKQKDMKWVEKLTEGVHLAAVDPVAAIGALRGLLETVEAAGNDGAAHAVLEVLVGLLINQRTELADAELLALRLVERCPDRLHLSSLARVCRMRGNEKQAHEYEERARSAPNNHLTPEFLRDYAEAVQMAEEEDRRRRH